MGDFCVAGFHSRLPIYNEDKVVAIICRNNDQHISNCPCYLEGPLVPFCMPMIGYMGDYGHPEYIEDNETSATLEKLTGRPACELVRDIGRVHQWTKDEELPDFYKTFDKCSKLYNDTNVAGRYYVIYEHYDIYKEMTFKWNSIENYCDLLHEKLAKLDFYNIGKSEHRLNPFSTSTFSSWLWWMEHHPIQNLIPGMIPKDDLKLPPDYDEMKHILSPERAIWNIVSQNIYFLCLYNNVQLDIQKAKREIAEFCSFLSTLECMYGHFYYSVAAGQSWHHDETYWKKLDSIQNVFNKTIERLKSHHNRTDEDNEIEEFED